MEQIGPCLASASTAHLVRKCRCSKKTITIISVKLFTCLVVWSYVMEKLAEYKHCCGLTSGPFCSWRDITRNMRNCSAILGASTCLIILKRCAGLFRYQLVLHLWWQAFSCFVMIQLTRDSDTHCFRYNTFLWNRMPAERIPVKHKKMKWQQKINNLHYFTCTLKSDNSYL